MVQFVGLRDRCQPPLQPKKAPLSRDVHSKVESERPAHAHGQPRGNRFDSNIPIAAITDPPLPIFSASAISPPPPPPPSSPLLPADASPDQELPADERASEPRGRMGYIGAHGVETLKRYRYSGQDHSVVAKYVLQPFWSRCVTLFPLWMP